MMKYLLVPALLISACSKLPGQSAEMRTATPNPMAAISTHPVKSIYWSDGDSGRITLPDDRVIKFRLDDWDAPETGGVGAAIGGAQCELERERGFASKAFMVENTRRNVSYATRGEYDGYERLLVDIIVDQAELAPKAFLAGHLKSWKHDGAKQIEKRPLWCAPDDKTPREPK